VTALDPEVCRRARESRDARFDGRFFIAVRTTGIYCRPVCPARSPKEENVEYFPSAAAAAGAGYRPCLRCRPDSAPGTPAWTGTPATVARALRLISENALDDRYTDELAERLGISGRHLRRLFLKHLGAPPAAIAQTRRVQFARQLIESSSLSFAEIAYASGFGSVRRFNHLIAQTYRRTPTQLRALATKRLPMEGTCRFFLAARPPFAWRPLLEFLSTRAIEGLEKVEGSRYTRKLEHEGKLAFLVADLCDKGVDLTIDYPDPQKYLKLVEKARRFFDCNADPISISAQLSQDPQLSPLVEEEPGLRVPGAWDGFELAVRAILGQQVSVRGATSVAGRLLKRFGSFRAEVLAEADWHNAGLPQARIQAIRALARATVAGQVDFDTADPESFQENLCRIPGIGPWTAQYIAMRALGEPDSMPFSDLILLRAAGVKKATELEARSQLWRPWRAYATMHLWRSTGKPEPSNQESLMEFAV
jgi:AraC family transcriptional regulator, regulatory protein of adaptative response / DNA-3-methyladenine glycosylase II